jgi:hypothetical protein
MVVDTRSNHSIPWQGSAMAGIARLVGRREAYFFASGSGTPSGSGTSNTFSVIAIRQ